MNAGTRTAGAGLEGADGRRPVGDLEPPLRTDPGLYVVYFPWIGELGGVFRAHEVYDLKTNSWARYPRMLTPRHGFATAVIGRRLYAVSGVNNAGGAGTLSVVAVNERYDP